MRRLLVLIAFAFGVTLVAPMPALAGHPSDNGWIHTGVGSEEEARSYPCPTAQAGGWERTGPVVCLAKHAQAWDLRYDPPGAGCSYYSTGWQGNCIFDIDMGDHVKVWGTRGIAYTEFTIVWGAGDRSDDTESGHTGSGGSSGSGSGPTGPDQPSMPGMPGAPQGPSGAVGPSSGSADPAAPNDPAVPQTAGTQPDAPSGADAAQGAEPSSGVANGTDGTDALAAGDEDEVERTGLPIAAGALVVAAVGGSGWMMLRRRRPVTSSDADGT